MARKPRAFKTALWVLTLLMVMSVLRIQCEERSKDDPTRYSPLAARRAHDPNASPPRKSIVEASLALINPSNVDYGASYESLKAALIDNCIRDRRFVMIVGLLVSCTFLTITNLVMLRDRKMIIRLASEFLADFYNDMLLARQQATLMTDQYNAHMGVCNRFFEVGPSAVVTKQELEEARKEVSSLRKELADRTAELLNLRHSMGQHDAGTISSLAQGSDRSEGHDTGASAENDRPAHAVVASNGDSVGRVSPAELASIDGKKSNRNTAPPGSTDSVSDYIASLRNENEHLKLELAKKKPPKTDRTNKPPSPSILRK
jgi:hypothetical protein